MFTSWAENECREKLHRFVVSVLRKAVVILNLRVRESFMLEENFCGLQPNACLEQELLNSDCYSRPCPVSS